jgi:hypothetical protein
MRLYMPRSVKARLLLGISLVIIFMVASILWHQYNNRYIPGKITVQQYTPDYLPAGTTIRDKSVEAWYIPAGSPARYTRLYIGLSNGFIAERKKDKYFPYMCSAQISKNETCTGKISAKGQKYMLRTLQVSKTISYSIQFVRGDTWILVNLDALQAYSDEELSQIIDSFKPKGYNNLPIHHIDKSII